MSEDEIILLLERLRLNISIKDDDGYGKHSPRIRIELSLSWPDGTRSQIDWHELRLDELKEYLA